MKTRLPLALAALCTVVLAPRALAADRTSVDADLGRKRSVSPDASLAGQLESRKPEAEEKGPALDFEAFRYSVEFEVSDKRREEIADLQKLIGLGGSPAEMPGWLFRLAELYWEESEYFFFEANRKDDAILALGKQPDPAEVARIRGEKKTLEERSRGYQAEAIGRYKEILRRFPRYPRLDEVLFFLGENLWKQQKTKEALEAYRLLITRFPKSRYVPDAWMAFGEYYFNAAERSARNDNLRRALDSYKKAASYTESSVYGYALYKQGWVYYNLGAWNDALDLFKAVIFFGDLPTSTIAADKKLALVKEARKDFVRTYSHVGSPQGALEEFRRVGGETGWWDMLKALAGLYFDEGKDRDAILVYHQLIKQRPRSLEAPYFQSRIVTAAGRMGRKDLAVQQAHVFVQMIVEIEGSKGPADEAGRKALADARSNAENTLRTLAVQYHNEFKKTRDESVAALAADVYRDYLQLFPATAHAYEMRFFHAELLFALDKYGPAGDEYTQVALQDIKSAPEGKQPEKPGKYFRDALENAVFAYDLVAKKFEETEKRPTGDPRQRIPVPAPKQQLLDACRRYLKYAPRGDKVVEVAYKAAHIYYRYNDFAEATDLFTRIALDHPRHELAGYATNLVLDAYNLLGDWRNVNGWAKRFYANAELLKAHPQLKDDLAVVIEQSAFKVIEEYERSRSYRKAAEAYLAFVKDWPGSKLAATALYNASVDYSTAHLVDRAVAVREQLIARYPDDKLAAKCIYANGADYEAIADFGRAADHYERYFHGWKASHAAAAPKKRARGRRARSAPAPAAPAPGLYDEEKARDALYNAGVFRAGMRDWRRAEADRLEYVDTWPDTKETPRVFLSLADLYGRERAFAKEARQVEEYQRRYAKDPNDWLAAQQRLARIYQKTGNAGGERRAYEQALAYYRLHKDRIGERGMPIVAQAMYLDLEPAFVEYDRVSLNVKPKLLKAQLEVKGKKLVELQKRYTAVVNLKQAEPAVCALYRIGFAYRRFAQALTEAPIPKELRALGRKDVIDEYKNQLAQLAAGPEQKAIEGLEYALVKSREYGVANDCSRRATDILVKYKPDQYGPPLEALPDLAGAAPEHREGYGLLAAVRPPVAPPAEADAATALPPLEARRTASRAAPRDPDLVDDPAAPRREPPPPPPDGKDEDLLP